MHSVERKSNTFFDNPLILGLDPESFKQCAQFTEATVDPRFYDFKEGFFQKGSLPSVSIISISENLRRLYKTSSPECLKSRGRYTFSPCFQCYTTLLFHAAMLKELKAMTKRIDASQEITRFIVWKQLFILVGVDRVSSDPFTGVLESTIKQEKMDLLEIEVMYLSFLLSLHLLPGLFESDFKETNMEPIEARLKQNATAFFSHMHERLPHAMVPISQSNDMTSMTAQSIQMEYLSFLQYWRLLQYWASLLSKEEYEMIRTEVEGLKSYSETSLSDVLKKWESDIISHSIIITETYQAILRLVESGVLKGSLNLPTFSNSQAYELMKSAPTPIWPNNPNHQFQPPTSPLHFSSTPKGSVVKPSFKSQPSLPLNIVKPVVLSSLNESPFSPRSDNDSPRNNIFEDRKGDFKSAFAAPQKKRGTEEEEFEGSVKRIKEAE